MADHVQNSNPVLDNFFQSDFFQTMVQDHMRFAFVGFDVQTGEFVTEEGMGSTMEMLSSTGNPAEYMHDRLQEMFCLPADEFRGLIEAYNATNPSSAVADLPVDLLTQVHDAGSQDNQEVCTFVAEYGQDSPPPGFKNDLGAKP